MTSAPASGTPWPAKVHVEDVVVTTEAALAALAAAGDGERAVQMAAYHKSTRRFFGVPVPQIDALVKAWRVAELGDRVALADGLWQAGVHEARVASKRSSCSDSSMAVAPSSSKAAPLRSGTKAT